jgi:type II secretory pathway pseudopilin PulG
MKYSIQKWGRIEQKVNPLQYELGGNMLQGIAGAGNAIGSGLQSTGSSFGTIGGGALKGAAAGTAILPGIGTVVGGALGLVGGIFKNKQRKEEEEAQKEQEKQLLLAQKQQQLLSLPQSSGGIGYETRLNPTQMVHGGYLQIPISAKSGMYISSKKQYKYGGPVNYTQDSTKSLVSYMGGGTHQQNPLGGIPLGKTLGGKQNTVEQGETSFKFKEGKYVFSNRLKLR